LQVPPLTLGDISLVFTIGALVLLITAEVLSPYYGPTKLVINKKKLQNVAIITTIIFLITVVIRIISFINV
jgi:hypothetical protein